MLIGSYFKSLSESAEPLTHLYLNSFYYDNQITLFVQLLLNMGDVSKGRIGEKKESMILNPKKRWTRAISCVAFIFVSLRTVFKNETDKK